MQFRNYYNQTVAAQLKKELNLENVFQVPKLQKIILNVGVAQPQDPRQRKQVITNI